MAVSQELVSEVKDKALKLDDSKVLEKIPGSLSISTYTDNFGSCLGKMDQDKDAWEECGYNWEARALGDALQTLLVDSQAEVIILRNNTVDEALKTWLGEKEKVALEKKRLTAANKFYYHDDQDNEAAIKELSKGSSNIEQVQAIVALVMMAYTKIDTMPKLTIKNVLVDKAYLDSTKIWAEELVATLGKANAARNSKSPSVNYRNRIVTLCEEFMVEVRKWVPIVYFDDPDTQAKFNFYNRGGGSGGDDSSGGNTGGGNDKKDSEGKPEMETSLV